MLWYTLSSFAKFYQCFTNQMLYISENLVKLQSPPQETFLIHFFLHFSEKLKEYIFSFYVW